MAKYIRVEKKMRQDYNIADKIPVFQKNHWCHFEFYCWDHSEEVCNLLVHHSLTDYNLNTL